MNVSLDRERRQDLPTGGNWSRGRCDVALWRLPLWELSGRVSCLDNEVEKKEKEHVLPRLCTTTRQRTTRRLRTLRSQRHVCTVPRKQDFPQILKRSTCTAENHNQKNFQNNVASHASMSLSSSKLLRRQPVVGRGPACATQCVHPGATGLQCPFRGDGRGNVAEEQRQIVDGVREE